LESKKSKWIPEICYEEQADGISSHIPFVQVPTEEEMPKLIYIFESRETGEVEPGENGEELPVFEMDLHQYADMSVLRDGLSTGAYDEIRVCLGLQTMKDAVPQGKEITEKIRENL
jgi:hypothetical protein